MENMKIAFREDKVKILTSFLIAGIFILILWLIRFFEDFTKIDLGIYGVEPRVAKGLIGVLTSPLIHSDFSHLFSNSISLFFLTFGVFYFYRNSSVAVYLIIYIGGGFLVWIFGRHAYHIGASGIVYGFASFLFFIGAFRKDKGSMALSLLIIFLYGSLVWGMLPVDQSISFESHIAGAVLGLLCAIIFRNSEPRKKYEWEEDEEEDTEEDTNADSDFVNEVPIQEDADEVYFDEDENYDEELERIKKNKRKK